MQLLFEDRFAPMTSTIGFLEVDHKTAAQAFIDWQRPLQEPHGRRLTSRPIAGTLEKILFSLLPLTDIDILRNLFIPTSSNWTAYFDNHWRGAEAAWMGVIAQRLGCRELSVAAVPNTIRNRKGRYGAVEFALYGLGSDPLRDVRIVNALNDGGRWVFHEFGEVLSFEETERYSAKRIKDKFTFDMLQRYLLHLGIDAFNEAFYLSPGNDEAILVEKVGKLFPDMKKYSLLE